MAARRGADVEKAARIALAAAGAAVTLDAERSVLYYDLVVASLGEAARKVLQAMKLGNYEYQSEFARRYFSQGLEKGIEQGLEKGREKGREEGLREGRVEIVLDLLTKRFGPLSTRAEARVRAASSGVLGGFAERILTACDIEDVLGRL